MKRFYRYAAFLLAVLLLLPLAGCTAYPTALSFGETEFSTNMYRFWLSSYKGQFLRTYADMKDTDAFYDSILTDNTTAEAFLNGVVLENVTRNLICAELFRQYGLTLPEETTDAIDAYIEELTKEYAGGSRRSLNSLLAEYGANGEILRDVFIVEEKVTALFQYLYGEGGPQALTEADLAAYYQKEYVRIRHIYVNESYVYELAEDGSFLVDSSGNIVTRALTAEELAEKEKKIAAIDEALANRTAFDTVYKEYSEDQLYENGYYLTRETDFIDEVVTAAFTLAEGSHTKVESEFGTHYLYRLSLDAGAYTNEKNADFFSDFADAAAEANFLDLLDTYMDQISVVDEELAPYSIRNVPANYAF